jgi:hypothetical protein
MIVEFDDRGLVGPDYVCQASAMSAGDRVGFRKHLNLFNDTVVFGKHSLKPISFERIEHVVLVSEMPVVPCSFSRDKDTFRNGN